MPVWSETIKSKYIHILREYDSISNNTSAAQSEYPHDTDSNYLLTKI